MGKESTTKLLVEEIKSKAKQEEIFIVSVEFTFLDYFGDLVFLTLEIYR